MRKARLLKAAFFTPLSGGRWGLPLLLWRPPGQAKTASVKRFAAEWGIASKVLPPGQMAEGAFGVTPCPEMTPSGLRLAFPPVSWVDLFANGVQGLVFVDETNTSPPALKPAVMGLVLDRRIGDHDLPPGVRAFGAANPTACSAGGWDLTPPEANRFGHIEWPGPDTTEWGVWLCSGANGHVGAPQDAAAEEARVLAAWPVAFAKAAGLVSAFLNAKPDLLHKMPAEGSPQASRAWPSPRSWEMATRALASCDPTVHGASPDNPNGLTEAEADELIAAFIGTGAEGEFSAWRARFDLPDPALLLDGKVKWAHDPQRLDISHAVLGSCAALVSPQTAARRNERATALWVLIGAVTASGAPDVAIPAAATLMHRDVRLGGVPGARKALEPLAPVLEAAGFGN